LTLVHTLGLLLKKTPTKRSRCPDVGCSSTALVLHNLIRIASGYLKGSVFVTYNATRYLIGKSCNSHRGFILIDNFLEHLRDSSFSEENDLNAMIKEFDERAKLTFRKSDEPLSIRFGGYRDTDLSRGIRAGQLKLQG
jgi:hypothetical protein